MSDTNAENQLRLANTELNKQMAMQEKARKELAVLKKSADEAREYAESIINTVREPLIILDHDLKVVSASRSFYDIFKVTHKETVGQLVYDLGNKQWDIPKLRDLLEKILPEQNPFDNYEVEHDFDTIGRRTMLLNARQIERVLGKERIILLAIEDITERRQLEILLENSELRYRRLFETANDGILLLEKREGKIAQANPAIMSLLGYSNEEFIGNNLKGVGFPDDVGTIREIVQTLEMDGIIHYKDAPIRKKTGQVVDTDVYMVDKASLIQCNIRDITERKHAEIAAKDFLDNIINAIADPVFVKDDKRCFVLVNDALCAIVGRPREELLGKDGDDMFPAEEVAVFREMDAKVIDTGEENVNEESLTNLSTGEVRTIVTRKTRYIDPAGKRFLVGVIRDITERKLVEEKNIRLEAQLQQAQKMEAIGTLAGGIAHDFNNILTPIMGYAEFARSVLPEDANSRDDLDEILKAANRAKELVKHILMFSRQSDNQVLLIQPHLIVKEALKLLRSSLPSSIVINQNIQALGKVLADPTQIHQIMMNLCTNASHAMPEDGGELSVSLIQVNIPNDKSGPMDLPPGPYLKLTVSDTGCGIAPDVINRIFDPYFTTKGIDKGTGLGLAVVHGIVQSHGGLITVETTPGKGTSFHVYLPEAIASGEHKETITAEEPVFTGTERILFVDDEPTIVKMGKKMLERLGYEVVGRASSVEALELFKSKPDQFDLIITDMTMPHMTGDQLSRELIKIRPDIPIILCTGFSENILEDAAKKTGIREFVMKPISRQVLSQTIRKVLDESKS